MRKYTIAQLKDLQKKTLEEKIALSKLRITEFYEHYDGNIIVSFSGGKDSTVLLHLARDLYPELKAVYCDTGLEYPEIKEHVKSFEKVEIIRPKMSFVDVINKYGWLFPYKIVAEHVYYAKKGSHWAMNSMKGLNTKGEPSNFFKRFKKWEYLVNSPFKISHLCCDVMKKKPFKERCAIYGEGQLIGTLAEESQARKEAWLVTGCHSFHNNTSTPLAFWTQQNILEYIKRYNLKIPSVYGDIIETKSGLQLTGIDRTGCIFCPSGVQYEKYPNRYQRLAVTHPKIYDYCLNKLGLKTLLDYVGIDYEPRNNFTCASKVDGNE